MPSNASVRFGITRNGQARCILSVAERPSGDLILNLRASQTGRSSGALIAENVKDDYHGLQIQDYRYSIHMSPNSVEGTNTLKLTNILSDKSEITAVQYTKAIKENNNFAPLYGRRCSEMVDQKYDIINKKGKYVSLGEILSPFTLVFSVFVGPSARIFEPQNYLLDSNYTQYHFREFSIVILWSFLSIVSHESSMLTHITSNTETNMPHQGCNEKECLILWGILMDQLRSEMIFTVLKEDMSYDYRKVINKSIYFKQSSTKTFAFTQWLWSLGDISNI